MKYQIRIIFALLSFLLLGSVHLAQAQSASVYFGLGTAVDSSNGQPVDTFGNGTVFNTPKMAGLFETLGGDVMFRPHLGVGFETSFRSQSNSAALNVVMSPRSGSAVSASSEASAYSRRNTPEPRESRG